MADRKFSMISCATCGRETEKKSGLQKYCPPCSAVARTAYVKDFMKERWKAKAPERAARPQVVIQCGSCAAIVPREHNRQNLCLPCGIEARRQYANAHSLRAYHEGRTKRKPPKFICGRCGVEARKTSSRKKYCNECAPIIRRETIAAWALKNPEAVAEKAARYKAKSGHIVLARKKERRKVDSKYLLDGRMSHAIRRSLMGEKSRKSWEGIVGYSLGDLHAHLERQFVRGMNWSNIGRWHIDHVVPLKSFSYKTPSDPEFRAAWALSNLRPLWAEENMKKSAKRLFLV